MPLKHQAERLAGVHRPRVNGEAGGFQRKSLRLVRKPQMMPDKVHEIGGVLPVMDGEGGIKADRLRELPQETRADGVKGAGPADGGAALAHAAGGEDALGPALHFLRGAPREGEEQHAAGIGALLDQMGDPVRQRLGLARARARDNQERSTGGAFGGDAITRGAHLVLVEGGKTIRRGRAGSLERAHGSN